LLDKKQPKNQLRDTFCKQKEHTLQNSTIVQTVESQKCLSSTKDRYFNKLKIWQGAIATMT
jgi:hypothetical protein